MKFCRYFLAFFLVAAANAQAETASPQAADEVPTAAAPSAPTINVGGILALSGPGAAMGTAIKNGMLLAHETIDPETSQYIRLVYEDDMLDPKTAVTAFKRLVENEKIDVVLNASSGTGKALSPLADREGLPLIAIASDREVVRGRSQVVNLWVAPEIQAQLAVAESLRRKYARIARITATHDFNLACRKAFNQAAAGKFKFVLDEEYPPSERDFRPYLTKLKGAGEFDAIFVNLFFGQAGAFAKQARELGIQQPLFAFEVFEDAAEVEASQGALLGQWYVMADDPSGWFNTAYQRRFPGASLFGAANGYDAILLIAAAMRTAPSRSGINRHLHNVRNFRGALGTYSASGDNRFTLPAAVKVVTKAGFEKLR